MPAACVVVVVVVETNALFVDRLTHILELMEMREIFVCFLL